MVLARSCVANGPRLCSRAHSLREDSLKTELQRIICGESEKGGGVIEASIWWAFKRPAPAVWGNGLWGSVGGAGRSYD